MNETPGNLEKRLYRADLLMMMLCSLASFALLASPLTPTFDVASLSGFLIFLVVDIAITTVLGSIGISLNHLAARNVRVTVRRRRR